MQTLKHAHDRPSAMLFVHVVAEYVWTILNVEWLFHVFFLLFMFNTIHYNIILGISIVAK